MIVAPHIDPVALHLGPVDIHWYGIMYLLGFVLSWSLLRHRAIARGLFTTEQVSDLIFYGAVGVILGGRIGYMVFYDFPDLIQHPLYLFKIWQGGMSFHGGFLGVVLAMCFYAKKSQCSVYELTDFIAPVVPLGLAAGRLGNFINGELWGRVTTVHWGMVFPRAGQLPRHPSQLYEFAMEGIILFVVLWGYSAKPRPKLAVSALFLIGYGICRIIAECFRQPDIQYGYLAWGWLTMGQVLSFPMVLLGIWLFGWSYRRKR